MRSGTYSLLRKRLLPPGFAGENNERCRRDLGRRDDVVTPDVVWPLTTPRVLTMSFEEGCHVLDIDTIRGMGVDPKDVSRSLSRTFAEQVRDTRLRGADPTCCLETCGSLWARSGDPVDRSY